MIRIFFGGGVGNAGLAHGAYFCSTSKLYLMITSQPHPHPHPTEGITTSYCFGCRDVL